MEFSKVLQQRSSVRNFKNEPVPEKDLREMVQRAGMAPSVNNSQPWKFLAITNKKMKQDMVDIVNTHIEKMFPDGDKNTLKTVEHFSTIFENAPAMVLVLTKPYQAVAEKLLNQNLTFEMLNAQRKYPNLQSVGAAVENFLLSAVDLNYGACWLSGLMVAEKEISEYLKIEEPWELVTAIAVGKPERVPAPKEKLPLEEIFELRA